MKILALNSSKGWGGNERWLTTALNGLNQRGHRVCLIKRTGTSHWSNLNASIETIDAPFTNEFSFKTKSVIKNIIKNKKIDILLSTKRKDYVLGAQIKNKVNIHHIMRLGISRPILKRDFLQRYIISNMVDGIIVNAKSLKKELLNYRFIKSNLNHDSICCIYNGYDVPDLKTNQRDYRRQGALIRAAGRLTAHKGYDILLSSLNSIKDIKFNYKLEIAGEGPDRNKLEKLIEKYNLQSQCELVGEKNDIINFFSKADLVIIPSRSEGIPNTLFEAWMSKKPIITTNVGGICEVVDNMKNGMICEPNSMHIKEALKKYIDNSNEFKKMGLNGYNKLIQMFTMEKMSTNLEDYFKGFLI
jgi:glycosyltransferase involved in cell wall biosynthesis